MFRNKYKPDKPYFYGLPLFSFKTSKKAAWYGSEKWKEHHDSPVAVRRGERRMINIYAAGGTTK